MDFGKTIYNGFNMSIGFEFNDYLPNWKYHTYGGIMDDLFNMWIQESTTQTFEEFCHAG
jgi:hypothetical protein